MSAQILNHPENKSLDEILDELDLPDPLPPVDKERWSRMHRDAKARRARGKFQLIE